MTVEMREESQGFCSPASVTETSHDKGSGCGGQPYPALAVSSELPQVGIPNMMSPSQVLPVPSVLKVPSGGVQIWCFAIYILGVWGT